MYCKLIYKTITSIAALLTLCLLTACGQTGKGDKLARSGINADYNGGEVLNRVSEQEIIMKAFAWSALNTAPISTSTKGFDALYIFNSSYDHSPMIEQILQYPTNDITPAQWGEVYFAGTAIIDGMCRTYLHELEQFHRKTESRKGVVAAAGSAISAVLGFSSASPNAIGIVATTFGFGHSALNIDGNSVLFGLEPSRVRGLVKKMQFSYNNALKPVDNKSKAFAALQGYVELCLPNTITSEVNNAVGSARVGDTSTPAPAMLPNPALQAPSQGKFNLPSVGVITPEPD